MISILWDASHLWGYLLLYAVNVTGIPFHVLKGSEIAQSGLSGKMLIVPGGSARRKAEALGSRGVEAVRRFVYGGGSYLGFCGGAGLALSGGVGLCPWNRAGMSDRLQHLVSGFVVCDAAGDSGLVPAGFAGCSVHLPVWWPGRFDEPEWPENVHILARYRSPGPGLYVADLPYSDMPPDILAEWKAVYGVNLRPSLLDGQPCMVTGEFGRGQWLLSYSHLETPGEDFPESLEPGQWFMHILQTWLGFSGREHIPPLRPSSMPVHWEDSVLLDARDKLEKLVDLAVQLGLLFPRSSWLMGWRSGIPGAQLNSLRLALGMTVNFVPDGRRLARWHSIREEFKRQFSLFANGARSWLLARRLSDTLTDSLPGILPREMLGDQRRTLFGSPMYGGGMCEELLDALESLV